MGGQVRIGVLSDIHVDLGHAAPEVVVDGLARVMTEHAVDTMIIAGDVANDFRISLSTLHTLERRTGARVLFVPGNHDIWNESHPRLNSWDIYRELLDFPGNLARGPALLAGGWAVIGDLGWYDYSFGGPEYSVAAFDRMQIGGRLWQDKLKAVWGRSTREMHDYFLSKLEAQLARNAGRKIILVTHAVPIRAFTVQPPDAAWNYLNAFLGSSRYGELALAHDAAYSICGHVHYRREAAVGGTTFICNCLNYAREWQGNADPLIEIRRAFKTIDIRREPAAA
jgi:putative phosphoesterase